MRTLKYDVVVIGGGPAGLAAALKAREKVEKVAVLERNDELGGILNQCIHNGFGLHTFKRRINRPGICFPFYRYGLRSWNRIQVKYYGHGHFC